MLEAALAYARSRHEESLAQLKEFLAIPSISTLPENEPDIQRAAQWLVDELTRIGVPKITLLPTGGHPVVYGEWIVDPAKPTLLVYGHYDVQPVDPIDEWLSPPFEPTVRGDDLYARGSSDMKGSMVAQLKAVEALAQQGEIPVNLKFLLEGEEEVGSPNLPDFIKCHAELLKSDVVVNCDGESHSATLPSITYALRGLAYFEIEVTGPRQDLHSGVYGGSIHNPAQALCELVAGMHDADGRVTVPGFYDKVRGLSAEERDILADTPGSDEKWLEVTGAPALWGEKGYTTAERVGARPTLEVCGIWGGFTGEGAKTVLPAKAHAKISMRLVPDQQCEDIRWYLEAYMRQNAPETIRWTIREHAHGPGAVMERNSPAMRAAQDALEAAFGAKPVFKREGGSVPVVGIMQQVLGVDSIMLGFRLPDSGLHGPNEKQNLPVFYKGIETYVRFMAGLVSNGAA